MNLENKLAIIPGGASGLGRAAAGVLVSKGARVVLLDMNEAAGTQAVSELGEECAQFIQLDVCDAMAVEHALAYIVESTGGIDICVNCAGIGPASKVLNRDGQPHDLALFSKVIQINLIGTFNVARCAAAAMAKNPGEERGVIINTASVAAFEGQMGQCAYAASKGGIVGMTLPMARDLASLGIRVNTIAPGVMATPLMLGMPEKVQQGIVAGVPFPHRLGDPKEFGSLVAHIAENGYLNGETIRLDGAVRMQPR